jgi:hypothetical protein
VAGGPDASLPVDGTDGHRGLSGGTDPPTRLRAADVITGIRGVVVERDDRHVPEPRAGGQARPGRDRVTDEPHHSAQAVVGWQEARTPGEWRCRRGIARWEFDGQRPGLYIEAGVD